jgi:predicted outer membrane repeat protein
MSKTRFGKLRLEMLEERCTPATFMVDRTTDTMAHNAANTAGTLRWCLSQAQNGDTIAFDPTQTLNVVLNSALPTITKSITIQGQGMNNSSVSRDITGPANFRIFNVGFGVTCTIENMEIAYGTSDGNTEVNGGGIQNRGLLSLTGVDIESCGGVEGGGIYSEGVEASLSISGCIVNNCVASDDGGGIYLEHGANVNIWLADSLIENNFAMHAGGGVYNMLGKLNVSDTTFSGNQAGWQGGGIYCAANDDLTMTGGQLTGNIAGTDGGGLWTAGTVTLTNVAVTQNTARGTGGGFYESAGTVTTNNGSITDNTAADSTAYFKDAGAVFNRNGTIITW